MDYLMHISQKNLITSFVVILLASVAHSKSSGLYVSIDGHYVNSNVEKKITVKDLVTTIEDLHSSVAGFAQGVTAGYRYNIKDKYLLA